MRVLIVLCLLMSSFNAFSETKKHKKAHATTVTSPEAVPAALAPLVEAPVQPAASAESFFAKNRDMQFSFSLVNTGGREEMGYKSDSTTHLNLSVDTVFMGNRPWGVGPTFNLSSGGGTSWDLGVIGEYDFTGSKNFDLGIVKFEKVIPFVKAKLTIGKVGYKDSDSITSYTVPYLGAGVKLAPCENFYLHMTANFTNNSYSYKGSSTSQTSFGINTGFGVIF